MIFDDFFFGADEGAGAENTFYLYLNNFSSFKNKDLFYFIQLVIKPWWSYILENRS